MVAMLGASGGSSAASVREIPEADQADAELEHGRANGRVAEGAQLGLALDGVDGRELGIHVARVTGELRHAVSDLVLEHAAERVDADLLEVGLTCPLAVEGREVAGATVLAQRQA